MDSNQVGDSRDGGRKIRVETILTPIDFSEFSSQALRYSIALAEHFRARLVLVSVVELPMPTDDIGYMYATVQDWDKQMQERAAENLRAFAAEAVDELLHYVCFTRTGDPTLEILDVAAEQHADLIVMGTHGRTGVKHIVLGSVAEKTVRCARCPVLVVRLSQREFISKAARTPRLELHEIIAPLDFSEGAMHALEWAETIAQETGARLNLLHIVPYHYAVGEYDALVYPQLEAEMVEHGKSHLAALAEAEQTRGIAVHSEVARGLPRAAILDYAGQQKGDLVVMGSRGLTGIKHLLLGSNAEYVIRHAPCAVLTVPYPKCQMKKSQKIAEPSLANV